MYQFPIGVMMESFRLDPFQAVEETAKLQLQGLQVYLTRGPMNPDEDGSKEYRAKFFKHVKDAGLVISAVCGDYLKGFGNKELNPMLIEKSKRIMDATLEFDTNIVTSHIGPVPADPTSETYKIMQDACGQLADYADKMGGHFAMETGPECSYVLRPFLDSLHSKGVAVNLDPANLVITSSENPVVAVRNLGPYIVHTHAKDGVCSWEDANGEIRVQAIGDAINPTRKYLGDERPLGEGDVPFPSYLATLEEVGYRGFLTIEREVGDNPSADIKKAADMLRSIMDLKKR